MSASHRLPRSLAPIFALICIGLAFGYAFSEEMPVGRVRGMALVEDNTPLSGATITLTPIAMVGDESDEEVHTRHATTGADGRFLLANVPAGSYNVSASTRAHEINGQYLTVDEGGTSDTVLHLTRSESELSLAQHQRVFGTGEKVKLPLKGYVDGRKPRGQDAFQLRLYKTRMSHVLQNTEVEKGLNSVYPRYGEDNKKESKGLPQEMLKPANGPAPQIYLDREIKITEADREGFYYQRAEIGTLPPGLYLTEIAHDKFKACTWLLITDTALVVKRSRQQLVAYAVDMKTGSPVPNSEIRTYRDRAIIGTSQTDARGLAELTVPPKDGQSEGTTVAIRGEDEAIVERSEYGSEEEKGEFAVHAYTDRPIYRPGHRINYKGIARRVLDPGVKYTLPTGQPIDIELRDPDGERVHTKRVVANRMGSFWGSADLSSEARTGVYTLVMNMNGEKHTHDIVVASYQKPEFEVTVSPGKKTYIRGETVEMNISAKFYFGTPVAGAKVTYYVDSHPDWSADYPDEYEFDSEEDQSETGGYHGYYRNSYRGETENSGEIRLDENGKAVLRFPAELEDDPNAPQNKVFAVNVTVEDESKREVTADGEAKIAQGDVRLTIAPEGYVAEPGKPSSVTVLARGLDGKPVPNLQLDLESGFPKWKKDQYTYEAFNRQTITTGTDGKATLMVTPPRTGELRLNALAKDSKGRAVHARAYLWSSGDDGGDLNTEYADLSVLTDKRRYNPGETARVLVNTAHTGQTVLLCIEGQRVYRSFLVPMTKRSRVTYVPVLAEYGPNVILTACYVQNKHFAQSEAQLRVSVPRREIHVTIKPDKTAATAPTGDKQTNNPLPRYAPRDTVTYQVQTTDAQGKPVPAEFSFGVVDESIYALAEDNPTALRDAFYPHRYNQVQTTYSFAVEYLGDADKAEPKIVARKEFPDTVFWEPALMTDAGGRATVRVPLKDNLTTWRATATVQTTETAFGRETNKVLATKDFFVRVVAPRFLTTHDRSRIAALLHNETGTAQTVLVRLRAEGITVDGSLTPTVQIQPGAVSEVAWNVTAGEADAAKIDVSAWTPRTAETTQFTDRIEMAVPIRPHGREEIWARSGAWSAGETFETPEVDPQAIPDRTRLTLRITPSVSSALVGAVDYLIGYPYGCTEQTMSRFLPDVLVQRAMRKNGLQVDAKQAAALPSMVRDGLARLARFQHSTGAWGWWEYDQDDTWMTAYVLYGLATARQAGYPVSSEMVKKGVKGGIDLLGKKNDEDNKAFLLYALALVDEQDRYGGRKTARVVRQSLRLPTLDPESLAYVVLLDKRLGRDPQPALVEMFRHASTRDGMLFWQPEGKRIDYHSSNSRLMTSAALRALLVVSPADPRINSVLRWLMVKRTGEFWESTRDTSWALAALCDYLMVYPHAAAPTGVVAVSVNGRPAQSVNLSSQSTQEQELILRIPHNLLRPGKNDIKLTRTGGDSALFYSMQLRQTVASEDMAAYVPPGAPKIVIQREYLRRVPKKAGTDYWTIQTEPTNNQLRQGDNLLVRLTVYVPTETNYVLIEDAFPSGCEITERGTAEDTVEWGYWWSSVDVRDDRIAFFARSLSPGKHILEYNLRAQTTGSYHALPTFLQAMYQPEIRAWSAESRVEVK